MEKIRPVAFIDSDDINELNNSGINVIADLSKRKIYGRDVPLYTREALEAVASAVYAKVGVALLKEVTDSGFEKLRSIDLDAIINEMTEE